MLRPQLCGEGCFLDVSRGLRPEARPQRGPWSYHLLMGHGVGRLGVIVGREERDLDREPRAAAQDAEDQEAKEQTQAAPGCRENQ